MIKFPATTVPTKQRGFMLIICIFIIVVTGTVVASVLHNITVANKSAQTSYQLAAAQNAVASAIEWTKKEIDDEGDCDTANGTNLSVSLWSSLDIIISCTKTDANDYSIHHSYYARFGYPPWYIASPFSVYDISVVASSKSSHASFGSDDYIHYESSSRYTTN